METKKLLSEYYKCLSGKGPVGALLSEDIVLSGTVAKENRGKEAFLNNLFFQFIKSLEVKTMIIENDCACAVVRYELVSSKGGGLSCDVAEIWGLRNGKLCSLAMYFDTAAYQKFTLPILFPLARLKKKKPPL